MKKLLALIVLAALLLPVASAAADRALVFNKGDEGSKFYRIPAVVTMPDGDLVAVADKRWDNNGDLPGASTWCVAAAPTTALHVGLHSGRRQ